MHDLIDRQAAIDALKHNQDVYSHNFHDDPIDKYTTAIIATDIDTLVNLPSVQPEITEDDVKEYCRKRCLIVVTSDFYDEMMSRWSSAQPSPCEFCKHNDISDDTACLRCTAERRTDEAD